MATAKWWICDDCKSLNDLPANKCYKCRVPKPASPSILDDEYAEVGGGAQKRVGITVDLNQVQDLVAPDPIERYEGGDIIEAYGQDDDKPLEMSQAPGEPRTPPPLRDPQARSISDAGGLHWTERVTGSWGSPAPEAPPAPVDAPAPATEPPPGQAPPPPAAPQEQDPALAPEAEDE